MGLFARDGHLLDLAIDRAALGDLQGEEEARFEEHYQRCEACRARAELAGKVLSEPLPPLRVMLLPTPLLDMPPANAPLPANAPAGRPAGRRLLWTAVAAALPLAALGLMWVRPPEAPDNFTPKGGGGLVLEVHRSTGKGSELLPDGSLVRTGDRLGFRVRSEQGGYLLILGVDARGHDYPCYPQGEAPAAARIEGSPEARTLEAAVALDATPGGELVYAIRCDAPFGYRDVAGPVVVQPDAPRLPEGCVYQRSRFPRDEHQGGAAGSG